MKKAKRFILQTVIIAAAYAILTILEDKFFGMTTGIVQVRISDAFCALSYFTPAAILGNFIGCLIANGVILGPTAMSNAATGMLNAPMMDIFLGSTATLVGCFFAYLIRKQKFLVSIPPIIFNTVTVVLLFKYAYRYDDSSLKCLCTVGVGEIIACGLLGTALILALEDSWYKWFPKDGKRIEEPMETAGVIESQKAEESNENSDNEIDKTLQAEGNSEEVEKN